MQRKELNSKLEEMSLLGKTGDYLRPWDVKERDWSWKAKIW